MAWWENVGNSSIKDRSGNSDLVILRSQLIKANHFQETCSFIILFSLIVFQNKYIIDTSSLDFCKQIRRLLLFTEAVSVVRRNILPNFSQFVSLKTYLKYNLKADLFDYYEDVIYFQLYLYYWTLTVWKDPGTNKIIGNNYFRFEHSIFMGLYTSSNAALVCESIPNQ